MKLLRITSQASAFTLVEALIGAAVSSIILAGLMLGAISLVRSSSATENFSDATINQARILDYLCRDVRRALTVVVTSNPTKLTVTVADQYAGAAPGRAFKVPAVSLTSATYGSAPVSVSYFLSGNNFVRQDNGVTSIIATNISDFQPIFDNSDPNGKTVKFTLTFIPKFKPGSGNTSRAGTTVTASVKRRNT